MTETAEPSDRALLDCYRYVFVVSYGRSGSTLLQSAINSTPGTQLRGENCNILYSLYRAVASAELTILGRARHPEPRRPDHPWFVGVQFHPELKSKPFDPHPLFKSFIEAAVRQSRLV